MNLQLKDLVINELDNFKAQDITAIDLSGKTDIADFMIIATGTSTRHLQTLADKIYEKMKAENISILGTEGEGTNWVLVDLGDVIVHLMLQDARDLYALEKLWSVVQRAD